MNTPRERHLLRLKFIAFLPYVKPIIKPVRCEGYRWSQMSWKAYRSPELREKYRCKLTARWKFTALRKSFAQNGKYCFHHLFSSGIMCDMDEEDRTTKYWKEFEKSLPNGFA